MEWNFLATIGRVFISFMTAVGRITKFTGQSIRHCIIPPFYLRLFLRQIMNIGYYSLPVVGMTALFTGMVLALQIYVGSSRFNAESAVATIVVIGLTRELAPVLSGLMVAGRVGAAIAAEIGTMRVTEQIDALVTLSFYYPDTGRDRSEFFSKELMNFMVLAQTENIPAEEVTGSYAGAMGLGQFMPSSYLEYAVDLDGDERRDLWSSMDDIIGSVANYLHRHGWEYGEPVVYPLTLAEGANLELVANRDYKPQQSMADITAGGFISATPVAGDQQVSVIELEEEGAEAYWLGFKNFYVITRYNRSPLYAMAAYQLSDEILKGMSE